MKLQIAPGVAQALADGGPVVALESTLICHGLPRPRNLELGRAVEAVVRTEGAEPATIAIVDGVIRVGLDDATLVRLATADDVVKCSPRDLALVLATAGLGATTVAGTIRIAAAAGIRVMATGGIGGVHRGGETSLDVSADLHELARSGVAVVCSGAKIILDLPRTLEVLETLVVPVVGYRCAGFPAFYARDSGLPVPAVSTISRHWRHWCAPRPGWAGPQAWSWPIRHRTGWPCRSACSRTGSPRRASRRRRPGSAARPPRPIC